LIQSRHGLQYRTTIYRCVLLVYFYVLLFLILFSSLYSLHKSPWVLVPIYVLILPSFTFGGDFITPSIVHKLHYIILNWLNNKGQMLDLRVLWVYLGQICFLTSHFLSTNYFLVSQKIENCWSFINTTMIRKLLYWLTL